LGDAPLKGRGTAKIFYTFICIIYCMIVIVYSFYPFEGAAQLVLMFLPFSIIILLINPDGKFMKLLRGRWIYSIPIILPLIASAYYLHSEFFVISYTRMGAYSLADLFLAAYVMVLVMVFTWFMYGPVIPVLAIAFLLYALLGRFLPGILHHGGLSIRRVIEISSIEFYTGGGVFGTLTQTALTYIIVFMVFAGVARSLGAMDALIDFARWLTGKMRYGIPQMAVTGSMFFGMFSGSGVANVVGTGSFTIPLMKRYGMPPHVAGSIESVASAGGQIMPPIMGASAFIMAEYLGVHYWYIALIGFLPAIIYYLCVGASVYAASLRYLKPGVLEHKPLSNILLRLMPLIVSLIIMTILGFLMYHVMIIGASVTLAVIVLSLLVHFVEYRLGKRRGSMWRSFIDSLLNGFRDGASSGADVMVMLACICIIVAVLSQTGLAQRISMGIIDISGGNIVILILLAFLASLLFGMAVTTVAVYILVATLVAPALSMLGVPPIISHYAVFYFALTALITPPVAPNCAVAASIARAGFMETCWSSLRIGVVQFILPFAFFTHQELLIHGPSTPLAFTLVLIGCLLVVVGLELSWIKPIHWIRNTAIIILGGLILYYPNIIINTILSIPAATIIAVTVRKALKR